MTFYLVMKIMYVILQTIKFDSLLSLKLSDPGQSDIQRLGAIYLTCLLSIPVHCPVTNMPPAPRISRSDHWAQEQLRANMGVAKSTIISAPKQNFGNLSGLSFHCPADGLWFQFEMFLTEKGKAITMRELNITIDYRATSVWRKRSNPESKLHGLFYFCGLSLPLLIPKFSFCCSLCTWQFVVP